MGEPDHVEVVRDLDDGVAGAAVLPGGLTLSTWVRACCQVPGASWRIRHCWPGIQVPPRRDLVPAANWEYWTGPLGAPIKGAGPAT